MLRDGSDCPGRWTAAWIPYPGTARPISFAVLAANPTAFVVGRTFVGLELRDSAEEKRNSGGGGTHSITQSLR
jgi:hypothetical protein